MVLLAGAGACNPAPGAGVPGVTSPGCPPPGRPDTASAGLSAPWRPRSRCSGPKSACWPCSPPSPSPRGGRATSSPTRWPTPGRPSGSATSASPTWKRWCGPPPSSPWLLSWWADRRGRRGPLLLAFAILPAANLATAFAPSLAVFAGLQGVARIGTIALGALGLLVIAEEVNPAVRGYASGIFALGLSMGTGFGLDHHPGGPGRRRGLAGPVRRSRPSPCCCCPSSSCACGNRGPSGPAPHAPLIAALHGGLARRFWPMAGLSFAVAAFIGPAAAFLNPRLVNDLGWAQGGASLLLVLASTPAVPAGPARRRPRRRPHRPAAHRTGRHRWSASPAG